MKPWGEIVKVEDVKVVDNAKVDDFDFIRDLYYKIKIILSYRDWGYSIPSIEKFYRNNKDCHYDFYVSINEDLPLNNILFLNSSLRD